MEYPDPQVILMTSSAYFRVLRVFRVFRDALLIDQLTLRKAELVKELKVKPAVLGVDAVHEAEILGRWWISYRAIRDTIDLLEQAGFKRYDIKIYVHVSHPTRTR